MDIGAVEYRIPATLIVPASMTLNPTYGASTKVKASALVALATGGDSPITVTAIQDPTHGNSTLAEG